MDDNGMSLDGGYLSRAPAGATVDQLASVVNDLVDRLNAQLQTQTLSDGNTKRFIFGFQQNGWPAGSFGIKISLPGVDVTTADANHLLFSWDFTTGTQYWYDPSTNKNYMQTGILPDGNGGQVIATVGNNVADIFS